MKNKKTIILLVLGILIVITLSVQVTYSYMKPRIIKDTEDPEIGINNCAKIILKDNESIINLTNMYPMDEEMGLQTDAYEFTISSTCEEYTGFNLYILTYEENGIEDNLIRYGITSKNDTLLETDLITKEEATDITEEEQNEINQGINKGYKKIYKVYSNNIPLKGESEYKLHIWIDSSAENETMNKNIKLGIVVKGYKREESLAEYLIKNKDKTLIYHDEKCDYEGESNCELEAGDYSYRYSGASEEVNNYICFGAETCSETENYDNLYRIIGLFKNDLNLYEIKLIKADYATITETGNVNIGAAKEIYNEPSNYIGKNNLKEIVGYYWNSSNGTSYNDGNTNNWRESNLNKINLNNIYFNYLGELWQNMIENHIWITGVNYFNIENNVIKENVKNVYEKEIGKNKLTIDSFCREHTKCISEDLTYPYEGINMDGINSTKIGLMYINDYGYAISSKYWNESIFSDYTDNETTYNSSYNWLFLGLDEWFITHNLYLSNSTFHTYSNGNIRDSYVYYNGYAIRPSFYLTSTVKLSSGEGTISNPYRLSM